MLGQPDAEKTRGHQQESDGKIITEVEKDQQTDMGQDR